MSSLKIETLSNLAGTKTIPVDRVASGVAAAWVNFNGTGTVAIRASYNVSSITDNGVGDYTVNFATALADANYAVNGSATANNTAATDTNTGVVLSANQYTTSSIRVYSIYPQDGVNVAQKADALYMSVSVFR